MNKTVIVIVSILSVATIICFIVHSTSNRYTTVNSGNGQVYKVDRRTGETILLVGNREIPMKGKLTGTKGDIYLRENYPVIELPVMIGNIIVDSLVCSLETNWHDEKLYFKVLMVARSDSFYNEINDIIFPRNSFDGYGISFVDKLDYKIFERELAIQDVGGSGPFKAYDKAFDSLGNEIGRKIQGSFSCSELDYNQITDWRFDFPFEVVLKLDMARRVARP